MKLWEIDGSTFYRRSTERIIIKCRRLIWQASYQDLEKALQPVEIQLEFIHDVTLILLRFATKNVAYVENTFLKFQYRQNLFSVIVRKAKNKYAPSCQDYFKLCSDRLREGSKIIFSIFAILTCEFRKKVNMRISQFRIFFFCLCSHWCKWL